MVSAQMNSSCMLLPETGYGAAATKQQCSLGRKPSWPSPSHTECSTSGGRQHLIAATIRTSFVTNLCLPSAAGISPGNMTALHRLQCRLLAAIGRLPACSTDRGQLSQHSSQQLDKHGNSPCHRHTACVQALEVHRAARHLQLTAGPLPLPAEQQQAAGRLCVGAGNCHTPPSQGLTSSDLPASPACLLSCTSSSSSGSPASTAAAYLFVLLAACACWASKAGAGGAARPSPPWTAAATTGFQASGSTALPATNGQ